MNRSFISVILGGFGGETAAVHATAEARPVKLGSANDAAFSALSFASFSLADLAESAAAREGQAWGEDPGLNLLALSYRIIYTILGSTPCARWAMS